MMRWVRRKSVLYIVLYFAVMGLVTAVLYSRYEFLNNKYIQTHVREFDQRIESYQSMQQRMMDNYYGMFLDSPRIPEIMYQAKQSDSAVQGVLRRELYGRMQHVFASLQEFDTRLLFFHLPGEIAFLRMHEPEKFGDSLTSTRPIIVKAQREQKKISSFETGKFHDGFRTIYPLFHEGHFSGTVEIAYPFLALKQQAMLQDQGGYAFLVKRSTVTKKSKASEIAKQYTDSLFGVDYMEDRDSALEKGAQGFEKDELRRLLSENKGKIQKALKQGKLQGISLTYKGKYALMVLKPVREIGGEQTAYMVEITPNHIMFATQWNQFLGILTAISFLLALLMWYIYRYNRSVIFLEQYKNAIEESMIVSRTDRKGIITYVNPLFVNISGYSEEELIGKPHSIVRHPDTPESVFKGMWSTIRRGENWHGDMQNLTKDGKSYFVKNLICPIVDENGTVLEYIGLREDITEIENSRLRAQEAERAKAAFVANMSHEIRTPINGIAGFVHLLSKSSLAANQRRYLSIIESSLETLLRIVNDVLDFSKIEEGKIEIEWIESHPKTQIPPLFELFSPQANMKKIDYRLMLDDTVEECLLLDILRIKQVIANLISNALKFTPEEGSVQLKIEVLEETASEQIVQFCVTDTGIGIPKEKQGKIFEKFTQADASTSRQYGGTGLGLSIAYAMVALMGGVLEIQSEEGKGSRFSFQLKARKCTALETEALKIDDKTGKHLAMKVLVVDDYEINRMLIGEILSFHYGIQADFANNGEEAIAMINKNSYDLVFMDVSMPVMDGITATHIIRKTELTLPIVALTANVMEGEREKFIGEGMNDYLIKPLDYDELNRILTLYSKTKRIL